MPRRSSELALALIAIVFITVAYLLVSFIFRSNPDPGSFFGHTLGIFGFLLMVMTEVLYSWRKKRQSARWGRMSDWLSFHIFTGLVGPYMVVLHAAWDFKGLAGLLTLMTIVVVASGFVGRYIYTAVPRNADGVEITLEELEYKAVRINSQLTALFPEFHSPPETQPKGATWLILGRFWYEFRASFDQWQVLRNLKGPARAKAAQLTYLKRERDRIRRQINSLNFTRGMIAVWHIIHVPLGVALFALAIIHIISAVYFATFNALTKGFILGCQDWLAASISIRTKIGWYSKHSLPAMPHLFGPGPSGKKARCSITGLDSPIH